jgi:hypothetical protein
MSNLPADTPRSGMRSVLQPGRLCPDLAYVALWKTQLTV